MTQTSELVSMLRRAAEALETPGELTEQELVRLILELCTEAERLEVSK